jgi:hypothetical protein
MLLIAAGPPQGRLRPPFDAPPPQSATRLPDRPAVSEQPLPERIPIDLGPDAPTSGGPPQTIDLLAEEELERARRAERLKECEERRQAGIIAGEILVCRELEQDDSQSFSGSRAAWLKDYAARTMGPSTPDVDNSGLPPGMFGITIIGCFIPPCPKDPALMIDVEAIPTPPAGSDAERVAQGQMPLEGDDAPLSEADRRRKEAELVLPEVPEGAR